MSDSSFAAIAAEDQARERLAATALAANKAALFAALAAAGISELLVGFDGAGDAGQIEAPTALAGETAVALPDVCIAFQVQGRDGPELVTETRPIAEAVEALAYDCLEAVADGWENNDGAYGIFSFNVAAGTITLELSTRVTETIYSEHAF